MSSKAGQVAASVSAAALFLFAAATRPRSRHQRSSAGRIDRAGLPVRRVRTYSRPAVVTWLWAAAAVVPVMLVLLAAPSLLPADVRERIGNTYVEGDQSAASDRGVNLHEVLTNGADLFDEQVTVSGRVEEILGDHAFVVGHSDIRTFVAGGFPKVNFPDLLLIVHDEPRTSLLSNPTEAPIEQGDVVQVTGPVLLFRIELYETERQISFANFGEVSDYDEQPVVDAAAIETGAMPAGPGDAERLRGDDSIQVGPEPNDILSNPQRWDGELVYVHGEVEDYLQSQILLLTDDELPVLLPEPDPEILEESTAHILGRVVLYDEDRLEEEFGLELADDRYEFEAVPVIIAEQVETIR